MKKILTLAFLVIGATTFSAGCDWFKGNTKYADKMVELVKKEGLTSKVYCDMWYGPKKNGLWNFV